jgi:hypothetical protein
MCLSKGFGKEVKNPEELGALNLAKENIVVNYQHENSKNKCQKKNEHREDAHLGFLPRAFSGEPYSQAINEKCYREDEKRGEAYGSLL